ncbi:MAG: thiamine pyrophosphate-binding protein [Carbonactinosporaceae bacterium]
MTRSGGRILVDQLERHGVRMAFCVPGESYLDALDALYDSPIQLVVCRQEGGAAYMAEAYAKLTGAPGVCLVTRGPGASNALVGVRTAWEDRTPLVLIVGLVARRDRDREAFQEIDLRGVYGTTAKRVEVIDDATRIPEHAARAFALARSGRPGPVVLGVPEDMLTDPADACGVATPDATPFPVPEGALTPGDLTALHDLLGQARRPLAVLGGNGWTPEAVEQVQGFAERWSLPVAVDFRCQDHIDNESPAYVGPLGYGRDPRLAERLHEADLVVAVGTTLGDVPTDGYTLLRVPEPGSRLVQVLPDPDPGGLVHRTTLRVVATPAAFARGLVESAPGAPVPWAAWAEAARKDHVDRRTPAPDGDPLDMALVMGELRDRLPGDAIVTLGAGNHALWAQRFLVHRRFPSQLGPRNGSMGYSVCAGVAAAIAEPARRVVAVTGDGCFLMNGQEIATALAYGAAPVILVANNASYGTIRRHQERAYPGRVSGTGLVNPDFAAYARAFGGYGEVVTRTEQVGGALDRAFAAGTVAVLDLRMDRRRLAPGVTVDDVRTAP